MPPVCYGNIGTSDFAVQSSSDVNAARVAYKAFDGIISNDQEQNLWHSAKVNTAWLAWHTSNKIKLVNVKITNSCTHLGITGGTFEGSNDNSNWISIKPFTNSVTQTYGVWEINSTDSQYYNYCRLNCTGTAHSGPYFVINEIDLLGKVVL